MLQDQPQGGGKDSRGHERVSGEWTKVLQESSSLLGPSSASHSSFTDRGAENGREGPALSGSEGGGAREGRTEAVAAGARGSATSRLLVSDHFSTSNHVAFRSAAVRNVDMEREEERASGSDKDVWAERLAKAGAALEAGLRVGRVSLVGFQSKTCRALAHVSLPLGAGLVSQTLSVCIYVCVCACV